MLPGATWEDHLVLGLTRNLVLQLLAFIAIILLPIVLVPVALWKLVFPDEGGRRPAVALLLVLAGGILLLLAAHDWGIAVRRAGLRAFVARAEPVVRAIHQYERDHGSPPVSIDALVPRYVSSDALRKFRLRACNAPELRVLPRDEEFPLLASWEVEFTCPNLEMMALDQLLYRSVPLYPRRAGYERFGNWVYYWD